MYDLTDENYKPIASLVGQESARLVKMGIDRKTARALATGIVGASLAEPTSGSDLEAWMSARMRQFIRPTSHKGERMTQLGFDDTTVFDEIGITVKSIEWPPERPTKQVDPRKQAMIDIMSKMAPGNAVEISGDKEMLLYLQKNLKHVVPKLGWGNKSYRSTLSENGTGATLRIVRTA